VTIRTEKELATFRYKVLTLLMLLISLAAIPLMTRSVGWSTAKYKTERLRKLNDSYKLARVPFPPEVRRFFR